MDELLNKKLLDASFMEEFENSAGWKIISSACKRISAQAQEELIKTPANETVRIIELQIIIKLYRNVISGIIQSVKAEGKLAFEEAKENGIINPPQAQA